MTAKTPDPIPAEALKMGPGALRLTLGFLILGAGALGAGALLADWEHFIRSYLTGFAFALSLALGALFFVILQHLTRSGWSVTVRRLAETMAGAVLPLAVLYIPVILGMKALYPWAGDAHGDFSPAKQAWLDSTFVIVRAGICFGTWILLSRFYLRHSIKQDESGDPALTAKMQKLAPVAMILYALTVTLFSFDLMMSLDPHWFSTIYGVYYFSGALLAFFAFVILMVFFLKRAGRLGDAVNTEHYHDLGKQLFSYIVFWAYIAFSQYMLIWYANIPEETQWYLIRQTGGWEYFGMMLVIGHFALPFLILLPRGIKRRPVALAIMSFWVLLMHMIDLHWLIAPAAHGAIDGHEPHAYFGAVELLCVAGVTFLFTAAVIKKLSGVSLIPEKDPRLPESLAFENH
jgi:hypothetical protein